VDERLSQSSRRSQQHARGHLIVARVFVTGGTGYVGRRLVPALAAEAARVTALVRPDGALPDGADDQIEGDLSDPASYAAALEGHDVIVHVAAVTGKAAPRTYADINVEGTRGLLAAAKDAGVQRVVFVSSIAARFNDVRRYPYARSKIAGERLVRDSGLSWSIVRPTIIVGPRAPVLTALSKLAGAPVVPLFGGARARVQPIAVEDLVRALVMLAGDAAFDGKAYDLGGPDVLTMRDLLMRLRSTFAGKKPRGVTVPAAPLGVVLGALEKVMLPVLPFTAGQMASFVQDGVAESNALSRCLEPLQSVDAVLRAAAGKETVSA